MLNYYYFPVNFDYIAEGTGSIEIEASSFEEAKIKLSEEMRKIYPSIDIYEYNRNIIVSNVEICHESVCYKNEEEFDFSEGPEDEIEDQEEHKNTIEEDLELGQRFLFNVD